MGYTCLKGKGVLRKIVLGFWGVIKTVRKRYEGAATEACAPGGERQNAEVRKVGTGGTGGILSSGFPFPGNVVRA